MTLEYPDVMNDLTDARLRSESGSVQYLAEFVSGEVPAGHVARLALTCQNIVGAPTRLRVDLSVPKPRGKLRRLSQAPFEVMETVIRLTLEGGEVGQLTVPVRVHVQVPPDKYAFTVHVESETQPGAARARPTSTQNQIEGLRIRYPQGLGITQIASWGFDAARRNVQDVQLEVVESAGEPPEASLAPQFNSVWTPQHWDFVSTARRELDERRLYILSELTTDRVFASMFQESPMWFAESGVQMHVGEALLVAKMLTSTVTHLLSTAVGQDCLLIPIFAYALANEQPTGDVLWLVTQLGYTHVLELAIAQSFSLVEQAVGRQVWNVAEQRAARDFVIESLNTGAPLPIEFLYLPFNPGGACCGPRPGLGRRRCGADARTAADSESTKGRCVCRPGMARFGRHVEPASRQTNERTAARRLVCPAAVRLKKEEFAARNYKELFLGWV